MLQDRSGVAAVISILMMTALLASLALVVDTSIWRRNKAIMQGAADSAALSAVAMAAAGGTADQAKTEATGVAAANGYKTGTNNVTVTVNNPPASGLFTTKSGAYEVIISQPQSLYFAGLIGLAPTLQTRAVGLNASSGTSCILALETSAQKAIDESGGTTSVSATGCNIAVNSSNSQAVNVSGGATLSTNKAFNVVGNYATSGGSSVSGSPITTSAATTPDPYASLAVPSHSTCDNSGYSLTSGSATINPGVYCGTISVSGGGTLTMNAGVYVIVGGDFTVSSSSLDAQGVSIAMTKNSSGTYGKITMSGGSSVVMTPTTSGSLQGVVFYQDRTAPTSVTNNISGGSNASITGSVYLPSQILNYSGGSSSGSGCLQLVARMFVFSGGTSVGNSCGSLTVPGMQSYKKGLVVE